ncbi:Spc7 kinetochore protein-domain-containing protein [Trametes maxima]|nr:Spc7 kinetochore protein-domain-containing protein [Trametes maxima]
MSRKGSPNRRRSIAVLGHGPAKTSSRRRAYSIAPGERLSPAAKARRLLAPRKSILKGSLNLPSQHARPSDATDSSTSVVADDGNMTQTMDFTQVHGQGPRKSLARRVSFAAHTHVRLFHKDTPDGEKQGESSSPSSQDSPPAFVTREINDENAVPGPSQPRRVSLRRRSSGVYSEFGERSMDIDIDETAPLPQHFLNRNGEFVAGAAAEDDEFSDEDDGSDMEITEAIARNIERKRSFSLGGSRASLGVGGLRRSSIVTAAQYRDENKSPSNGGEIPEEGESFEHEAEDVTGSSFASEGSSGEPMEFTIPVLQSMRQPREPDPVWLQLRAITHAGSEPYEPPPPESDDDAVMIQPSPGQVIYVQQQYDRSAEENDDGGEQDMDLTSAMTRLQQARASLGLGAPILQQQDNSFSEEERRSGQEQVMQDDTFSTEDSFGDESADLDNRTINLTQRTSLGTLESSMDETDVRGGILRIPLAPGLPKQPSPPTSTAAGPAPESTTLARSLSGSVFTAPNPGMQSSSVFSEPTTSGSNASVFSAPPGGWSGSRVFSAPATGSHGSSVFSAPATGGLGSSVFSAPTTGSLGSSVFSAPAPGAAAAPKPSSDPPRSPSKSPGPATIPKPFHFSLPRVGSPSKITVTNNGTPVHQPHRGTAAFAPPTAPKSPKRSALELPQSEADGPSPAKRPAVGRLPTARVAAFEQPTPTEEPPAIDSQTAPAANGSRRSSIIRRPAGYFAQRKSLGVGALPPLAPSSTSAEGPSATAKAGGLRPRASMGAQPSGTGLGAHLSRSHSDPVLANRAAATQGEGLYPDLTQLASEAQAQRAASPSLITDKGKGKELDLGPVVAPTSPLEGVAAIPSVVALPATTQPTTPPLTSMGPPATMPVQERPLTHIVKPSGGPTRIIDVSMAMDLEPDASIVDGSAAVSQAWRESVPEEPLQDDDGPTISIEQFFQMTGIRFMDELTMPKPRRSTVLPGQLRPRPRARRRSSSDAQDLAASGTAGGEDEEVIPLAEFAVAMAVDMPRLDLYGAVARDLTAYIQECKKIYREAEEEALKVTPSLFKEFAGVDEAEQSMLIHQLKLIKANNIGAAKSQWYDWKLQWVEQLYQSAAEGFTNLESDATYLAGVIKEAQDVLPALRDEYAEVMRLLQREQADIDEIENSDKDFLNELKGTIAEQSTEIEALRADVSEAKAKLERLNEKLAEVEAQKEEASSAISKAKHVIHIQKESTSAEVFRLKDELEALQDLHLWRTAKHTLDLVEFVYAAKYHVSLPCKDYKPVFGQATVVRTKQAKLKERDAFPQFTDLVVRTARNLVAECGETLEIKQVLERLGDFWSSCAQLRSQFTFLAIKYPLAVEDLVDEQSQPMLRATATVMFPSAKGKAFISFLLDRNTYSRWPLSVNALKADVKVAYGEIEQQAVLNAVLGRLAQVTPADSHGCLLDACIEATEQYEQ